MKEILAQLGGNFLYKSVLKNWLAVVIIVFASSLLAAIIATIGIEFTPISDSVGSVFLPTFLIAIFAFSAYFKSKFKHIERYMIYPLDVLGGETNVNVTSGDWFEIPFFSLNESQKFSAEHGELTTEEFIAVTDDDGGGIEMRAKMRVIWEADPHSGRKFSRSTLESFTHDLDGDLVDKASAIITENKYYDNKSLIRKRKHFAEEVKTRISDIHTRYGVHLHKVETVVLDLLHAEDEEIAREAPRASQKVKAGKIYVDGADAAINAIMAKQKALGNPITFAEAKDLWEMAAGKKTKTTVEGFNNSNAVPIYHIGGSGSGTTR